MIAFVLVIGYWNFGIVWRLLLEDWDFFSLSLFGPTQLRNFIIRKVE